MPAFELIKFQHQLQQLLLLFALPTDFHQELTHFFGRYEQPAYRYGVGVAAPPEPAYHLAPLMLEEMQNEFQRMAAERPRSALFLARECWGDNYYEVRLIAAGVMGAAPIANLAAFEETFLEMLAAAGPEYELLLFKHGLKQFREEHFPRLATWIEDWLEKPASRRLAFSALQSLVEWGNLDNLPTIFRLIEEPVIEGAAADQEALLRLMDGLARLSPMETTHFLGETTRHFYGGERMRYFRSLMRSLEKPERDYVLRSFLDKSAHYHDEDVLDD